MSTCADVGSFTGSKTSVVQTSNVGFTSEDPDYLVVHTGPDPDNIPVQSDNIPVQSDNIPVQANNIPVQADNIPVQADNIPVQADNIPVQAGNKPRVCRSRGGRLNN